MPNYDFLYLKIWLFKDNSLILHTKIQCLCRLKSLTRGISPYLNMQLHKVREWTCEPIWTSPSP